jgi:hypothetical protein
MEHGIVISVCVFVLFAGATEPSLTLQVSSTPDTSTCLADELSLNSPCSGNRYTQFISIEVFPSEAQGEFFASILERRV